MSSRDDILASIRKSLPRIDRPLPADQDGEQEEDLTARMSPAWGGSLQVRESGDEGGCAGATVVCPVREKFTEGLPFIDRQGAEIAIKL